MGKCKLESCNNEVKKPNKFCSLSCSATYNNRRRIHSENTKLKISKSIKEKYKDPSYKESARKWQNTNPDAQKKTWLNKLMSESWESLSWDRKRKRIIYEQNYKCDMCGLSTWLDKPIKFEIDHIDGDNKNNDRGNLKALCPNCHSQTDTWRGNNKNKSKVSDLELIESLKKSPSIRQALLNVGLVAKGNNYRRAKNLLVTTNTHPKH